MKLKDLALFMKYKGKNPFVKSILDNTNVGFPERNWADGSQGVFNRSREVSRCRQTDQPEGICLVPIGFKTISRQRVMRTTVTNERFFCHVVSQIKINQMANAMDSKWLRGKPEKGTMFVPWLKTNKKVRRVTKRLIKKCFFCILIIYTLEMDKGKLDLKYCLVIYVYAIFWVETLLKKTAP